MIWLTAAAGGLGVLLGLLSLRVYAIVAASVALVLLCLVFTSFTQPLWLALAAAFAAVTALQCGYLVGIWLSLRSHASKAEHTIFKSSRIDQ